MMITAANQGSQIQIDTLSLGVTIDGTDWSFTSITGWVDPAPMRDRMVDRPSADGLYDSRPYRGGRLIVLDGFVAGPRAALAAAQDVLAATAGDGQLGSFTFTDPDLGVRGCQVRLTGNPMIDASAVEAGMLRWQLAFKAPDWRKYGAAQTLTAGLRTGGTGLTYPLLYPLLYGAAATGGVVTFTNTGTAPTEPVVVVTGPFAAGFEITHVETGRRLRYAATVGSDLVLDCAAGTALTQGQERATSLTIREWFSIPAGATATFSLSSLGGETAATAPTAGMTVTISPAYS